MRVRRIEAPDFRLVAARYDASMTLRIVVAPLDAAESIASEIPDAKDPRVVLHDVYSHEVAGLQCLLAGDEPFTPTQPVETRYSKFTRGVRTLTQVDVALASWRGFVAGEWRSDAEIADMAEDGALEDCGTIVYVAPDTFVDALTVARDESTLAAQWGRTYRESFDAAMAVCELIRAAHAAKDAGKRLFLVDRR
jgi:hypothetical protein